jgi:2-C-methyl-D-erythritol 4-phosphate cytidylyltransferase
MKRYAIIVAGGTGHRFGTDTPKQFLLLKGVPILIHTLNLFYNFDNNIELIVTLPPGYIEMWALLCTEYKFKTLHKKVEGGETRFHSVKNGLGAIKGLDGLVAVHDGVRPLASKDTLLRCFETARRTGNAVPSIPLYDSIRELKEDSSIPVNREAYVLVQTPQVFNLNLLKEAYKQPYNANFTDDAHVVEKAGSKIILVEGNRENIKITNQSDFIIAEALMNGKH